MIDLPIENKHVKSIQQALEERVEEKADVSLNWIEKIIRKSQL